jgi:superfamily II DNA or RNA helicase
MGSSLLTYTMDQRHQLGLDSYDRLFPNQDTMPKGGLGNLISLPLQGKSRQQGNAVFLDDHLEPYPDQWAFLSSVKKMKKIDVEQFVNGAVKKGSFLGGGEASCDEPWLELFPKEQSTRRLIGPFPEIISIVESDLVYIEKGNLSPSLYNHIQRMAAFSNPEYYEAQSMRRPTYNISRIINCSEQFSHHLALPRGCKEEVVRTLADYDIKVQLKDERVAGEAIQVDFHGELFDNQKEAVESLLAHETGVLSATTAFGKTVVAAWMMAARGVNTLILVHRKQLMEQWKERLSTFLRLPLSDIGQIGGGKNKRTGKIDIALLQSVNRQGMIKEFVSEYGHVIVDECHHLSAFSFEQIMKKVKAKYVLDLTATPIRKDGHYPIIMMQCGPIRYRVDAKQQAESRPFEYIVVPRYTRFQSRESSTIQDVYSALTIDEQRNDLIFDDLLLCLEEGRTPLLLTERTAHVEYLANRLNPFVKNVLVLRGGMGKKQLDEIMNQLKEIPDDEERVIIATGRYIGEGFDDPRLDTLFLAMPISWKGTLQQYAGRLHRLHPDKKLVQVYDYVDRHVPMLFRMYEKRKKGYENMGYRMEEEIWIQERLNI